MRGEIDVKFERHVCPLGHAKVKCEVIRFTGYGVIAEKPRVDHLPRNFPCTL